MNLTTLAPPFPELRGSQFTSSAVWSDKGCSSNADMNQLQTTPPTHSICKLYNLYQIHHYDQLESRTAGRNG